MAYIVKAPDGIKMMATGLHIPHAARISGGNIPPHIRTKLIEAGLLVEIDDNTPEPEPEKKPDATDSAQELALANDVDLADVVGTGKDGRITVGDVREAIANRADNDKK